MNDRQLNNEDWNYRTQRNEGSGHELDIYIKNEIKVAF